MGTEGVSSPEALWTRLFYNKGDEKDAWMLALALGRARAVMAVALAGPYPPFPLSALLSRPLLEPFPIWRIVAHEHTQHERANDIEARRGRGVSSFRRVGDRLDAFWCLSLRPGSALLGAR